MRVVEGASRTPGLRRALTGLEISMWILGRKDQGVESADMHALVKALCFRHDWVFVQPLAELLDHLVLAGKNRPLTLPVFKHWMRLHVVPVLASNLPPELLNDAHRLDSFLGKRDVSWQKMRQFGHTYALGMAMHPYLVSVGQLMMVAREINRLLGWGEVRQHALFCEFCWRFKLGSGKYCAVHSTKRVKKEMRPAEDNCLLGWVRNGDYYRYSHSLKKPFDSNLHQIRRIDKRQLAKSSWNTALAEGALHGWLAHHRRTVCIAICHVLDESGDSVEVELSKLVHALDTVAGESQAQMQRRADFHRMLVADRAAIFEMLQRAEAWLAAAQARRKKWGGAKDVNREVA